MPKKKLTPEEERVILHKGTEPPFTGKFVNFHGSGTYVCKVCGAKLFRSESKFDSGCGWPSFDEEIDEAVERIPDPDGSRTEIVCANCGAHLGHVFEGEGLTPKNVRHCVNSISMEFIPDPVMKIIVLGGGCFWCTEAIFKRLKGVKSVTPGYAGGSRENPTYEQVATGLTGHAEVVQVEYDENQISLDTLLDVFFSSHDPTTENRQGADIGSQYRSIILYSDNDQKSVIEKYIDKLKSEKVFEKPIVTEVKILKNFYPAESYHYDYFTKQCNNSYCRVVITPKIEKLRKRFEKLMK